jgi:hypothetical protein
MPEDIDQLSPEALTAAQRRVIPSKEDAARKALEQLGPLGEAGMMVGDWMRTGHVEPTEIAPAIGGVMLGTAGPPGEGAAARAGTKAAAAALHFWEVPTERMLGPALYRDARLRGSMNPLDELPLTFNGKAPKDWTPTEFKEVGDIVGVPELGPDSQPVKFQYADGGEFHIPGGLEGKFTYYDLLSMKAQGIDASRIPLQTHAQIQQKILRTMTPAELSNEHVWDGLVFGLTSPNNPLFPNQLSQSRLRLRDPAMLDQLANMVPWKAGEQVPKAMRDQHSDQIAAAFGLQGAAQGGLGVRGSQDYTRIAELAQMFKLNPDFFRKSANEGWDQFVERIASQVGGLKMKTGSLGSVWQDPGTAAVSAIDRHMANKFEREGGLFKDETERLAWETQSVARWNKNNPERQVENFYQLRRTPGTDGYIGKMLLEYVGATKDPKFRYATGEISPNIPQHLAQAQWAVEPKNVEIMGERYRRALELNNKLAQEQGLNLFGSQWLHWDRLRRRLEPHENMFPGLERMPAMSREQLAEVDLEHRASGHKAYTKYDVQGRRLADVPGDEEATEFYLQPTKPREEPSRFGYFALPLAAGGAGAAAALQEGNER